MKSLLVTILLLLLIYLLAEQIYKQIDEGFLSASLLLSGVDTSKVENTIFDHYKRILPGKDWEQIDKSEIKADATYLDINQDNHEDLLVILKSPLTCGSGGCISSIFLQTEKDRFKPIDFMYTVKTIEPLQSFTEGMRDLQVNEDRNTKLIWNGSKYRLESR